MQLDNLGIDYIDRRSALIDAVTLADAKRVAKRLLDGGPALRGRRPAQGRHVEELKAIPGPARIILTRSSLAKARGNLRAFADRLAA